MVWFILAFIVAIIIGIKEQSFGYFATGLFIGCLVAFIIGCLVRETMPDQFEVIREEKLIKLGDEKPYITVMNNDGTTSNPTLVFTVLGKDDKVVTYKISVKSNNTGKMKTIVETDLIEPKYVRQKMRPMYEYWELFAINFSSSEYVLYVPSGSIEYDYNVK